MKLSVPDKIVLIGASTGGPGQIQKIITSLPELKNTTIIIAQHMVKGFIPSFMNRLKLYTENTVSMAEDKQTLVSGQIYLCDGHTRVIKENYNLIFSHVPSRENSYNPNINILFHALVPFAKNIEIMGVILTGIGDDGVDGCKELSLSGCTCLTETEQSAIVDGMTSRARQTVPNIKALNIKEIIQEIEEFCS